MQLLDFDLFGNLIHTLEPLMRQASVLPPPFFRFIVTDNTLGIGCALPTAGRAWDFHPLECALTAHTKKTVISHNHAFLTALPMVVPARIELATHGFSVRCSTD